MNKLRLLLVTIVGLLLVLVLCVSGHEAATSLFSELDTNEDGVVDELELMLQSEKVSYRFPAVKDAVSLLQVGDSDHDGVLNHQEFLSGLNLHAQTAREADTFLVEASSAASPSPSPAKIDKSNDGCIICQYVVSQVDLAIKMSGVMPLSSGRPNRDSARAQFNKIVNPSAEQEEADKKKKKADAPAAAFLQVLEMQGQDLPPNGGAALGAHFVAPPPGFVAHSPAPMYYGAPAFPAPLYLGHGGYAPGAVAEAQAAARSSGMRNAPKFDAPKSNRYWDKMEWNLANNLNHVADLTLDDVCESSMPNEFYAHCKVILGKQKQIVNLIGRQFKPEDVCQRVDMCSDKSYVALAVHTPSPPPTDEEEKQVDKDKKAPPASPAA